MIEIRMFFCSGLDNAGKTTILKKFMGEDIDTISPTLGFNIQTLEYAGYVTALTGRAAPSPCLYVNTVQI